MNTGTPTIALRTLQMLWLQTGSACNLSCPFCHEGAAPGDTRLPALGFAQACEAIDAAVELGVAEFGFTGGEPLIHREILRMLDYALARRPCLVLTNGTAPMIRRAHHLAQLRAAPHALRFRVSIDYADEARHDAGRGLRNFRKALQGLRTLHEAGFEVGITRRREPGESRAAVNARFRQMLLRHRLPEMPIVALPELGPLAAHSVPDYGPGDNPEGAPSPLCATSRTVLNRGEGVAFAPCPLVDDDPRFLQSVSLAQSCGQATSPVHARCTLCRSVGVPYSA